MVFPVIGGDGKPTGYEIDNSVRLSGGAELTFTPGQDGTKTTFTISCWAKKSENAGERQVIFGAQGGEDYLRWTDDEGIQFQIADASASRSHTSSPKFRDPSAWYHIVAIWNTTDGTNANRMQVYVNGGLLTPGTQPTISQNAVSTHMNDSSQVHHIGGEVNPANDFHFEGHLADFNFIDGSALDPTYFGETNDNGVWIPKKYDGSYGTNGFFLEFQQTGTGTASASTIGADTSGNTNHLTSTNLAATDITTDSPTNNFMTGNPLAIINGSEAPTRIPDYSEGNTVATASNGTTRYLLGTFATSMPYYFEVKVLSTSSTDSSQRIGIVDAEAISNATTYNVAYQADGVITATGESNATGKQSITANDIIGVAVDLATNNNVKLYHNGTLQATMSVGSSYQSLLTTPFARLVDATQSFSFNFGNPSFAISSGNADANGYGNFEYAVPSGYYALCTKNLAEYG